MATASTPAYHALLQVESGGGMIPDFELRNLLLRKLTDWEQIYAIATAHRNYDHDRKCFAEASTSLIKEILNKLPSLCVSPPEPSPDLMGEKPTSSGSAAEQPEPREECRPVMGTGIARDTGRRESRPRGMPSIDESAGDFWIETAHSDDLRSLSEAILDELDSRGEAAVWTAL